jgi:membrane-bound lytic murein transglycosylase A
MGAARPGASDTMAPIRTVLTFAGLPGWPQDDHAAALSAYRRGLPHLSAAWPVPPADAIPRGFFETAFAPVLLTDDQPPLFTGYFEPELDGALTPDARFCHPLYRLPPPGLARETRTAIQAGALDGQGLEIAWTDDPVALYFLQVQGSGRLRLPDGAALRLGYAGQNGLPYQSLGRLLIARGAIPADQMTADTLATWLRADPARGQALIQENPSYVFFRELAGLDPADGPIGTLGCPLTPLRSVAVDRSVTPLGAPVWIETAAHRALMIAQDTGGAIKGAQRADLYHGTGTEAGLTAGRLAAPGRMVTLLPTGML